jgi:hypothetical protein
MFDEDEYVTMPSDEPITSVLARVDASQHDVVSLQRVWYERSAPSSPSGVAPYRSDTLMDRHFVRANPQQTFACFAPLLADYSARSGASCTKFFVRGGVSAALEVHHTIPSASPRVRHLHPLDAHLMHLRFMVTSILTHDRNMTQSLLEYCEHWPVRSHALLRATNTLAERLHVPTYALDERAATHVFTERCRERVRVSPQWVYARAALAALTLFVVSAGAVRWSVRKAREHARIE